MSKNASCSFWKVTVQPQAVCGLHGACEQLLWKVGSEQMNCDTIDCEVSGGDVE